MDDRRLLDHIESLRAAGYRIAIDDFGSGHSSLSRIAKLPVDILKIDRSLTAQICESPRDHAIVRAIIATAEALDATVVAEGIETEAQRTALRRLGVRLGQGYLFARPMRGPGTDRVRRAARSGIVSPGGGSGSRLRQTPHSAGAFGRRGKPPARRADLSGVSPAISQAGAAPGRHVSRATARVLAVVAVLCAGAFATIVHLQWHAAASSRSQLALQQASSDLQGLASVPFTARPASGGTPASALRHLQAGERRVNTTLKHLRDGSPPALLGPAPAQARRFSTPSTRSITSAYRRRVRTARGLPLRGLGSPAAVVNRTVTAAARVYSARAAASQNGVLEAPAS